MNNAFLTQLFDWKGRESPQWVRSANAVLERLRLPWKLQPQANPLAEMTTLEQRLNLWHLAVQPVAYSVPGDYVELGCFDGKTAVIFARVLQQLAPERRLHVFDHFQIAFHLTGRDIEQELIANFRATECPLPIIHKGDFAETVPAELPEQIAFVHIDCGFGGDADAHAAMVERLLSAAYPRMPQGAIGVLMDFHEPEVCSGPNHNPGVTRAAAKFFASKPEEVSSLWAAEYSHGYFRKQ